MKHHVVIESLPARPLTAGETDRLDESSDSVTVHGVSALYPDDGQTVQFEVYTVLVETSSNRYLIGYNEDEGGWVKIWSDGDESTYEDASAEWMRKQYGSRIAHEERIDATQFE